MITVTAIALSQIAPTNQPFNINNNALILAARQDSGGSQLVICDWSENTAEQVVIDKINAVKRYQGMNKTLIPLNKLTNNDANQRVLLMTIAQLSDYFFGRRQDFDLPLDMSFGTPFQNRVWQALQSIPFGQTISYSQLASMVGNPKAYRAVANANGKNPFSILIPCHRVIAHDGGLGGYTGGIDKKRYLLAIEGQCF